jgi:hypothetical protein
MALVPREEAEAASSPSGSATGAAVGTVPMTAALDELSPLGSVLGDGFDLSALVGNELRAFPHDPAFANQDDRHVFPSVFGQFELVYEWNDDSDRLTLLPFGRWAPRDGSRTHADVREVGARC